MSTIKGAFIIEVYPPPRKFSKTPFLHQNFQRLPLFLGKNFRRPPFHKNKNMLIASLYSV